MSKKIKFLWIGKLKKPYWQQAAQNYLKKLAGYYSVQEVTLKDGHAQLSRQHRLESEQMAIQKSLQPKDFLIALDSLGKQYDSRAFAHCLQSWLQEPGLDPCFLIGGPFGLNRSMKEQSHSLLSLGRLTLPHELARVILLEQIYRASTILCNHPYHHS